MSCFKRQNETGKNSIPRDKLTDIITDLYITDGLVAIPEVNHWYKKKDSISAYREVIEGHGYSKDEFDATLRFYFIKKPKQLMKIYEQALARLSEMETLYDQEVTKFHSKISNYWTGREFYSIPGQGSDSTAFDIKTIFWNVYYLSFSATFFPDDQSVNNAPVIYSCHPDSTETGKRHYVTTMNYIKDGVPHKYTYQINDPDKSHTRIMGDLSGEGNNPSLLRDFIIDDISLIN